MRRINLSSMTSSSSWQIGLLQKIPQWQKQISFALTLLLLILSAWIMGKMVWLLQQNTFDVAPWVPTSSSSTTATQQSLDLSSLQQGDLFGRYSEEKAEVVQTVVKDAPKTSLSLLLVGVVASNEPSRSLAVIANRGSQATYGVNEVIEGTRAKLKAVLVDRVIIDNSGRDETLMLDGVDYHRPSVQVPEKVIASNARGNNPASEEEKLDDIRIAISRNPQEIFKYVRLSQVKRDDKVLGYRVSPGKSPELFESVGLQNDDIAIQLNGQDLTDPDAMSKIFQSVSELTEINLTVERDGQPHDIYIQF
ncbi:type II secretion system protein GspC [Vibrio aestuarianus]|uniref:Type II secretion system protein C n=2 Tax=Vibrio aestuarianus TaxID=28171 RepID=A0ABM9FUM4_9VIBR|nr:type II secretion system protein GspC [Vibrio aestuarianus]MDE1214086.1 type II secretion system protein GspC [Vibrio aestuarianus]MDE1218091.1 type II secretion system protein GspC [Vibrio aestuarianus]MDE1226628.1 type II secretion system protein GspC [Vibrio aestuarianus]MDE1239311.1 type II secretion system protein GspC [Vibrio aestuarianus]MDE1261004.1 type II secretion system protein GspC [Vibrio aestuarianus]